MAKSIEPQNRRIGILKVMIGTAGILLLGFGGIAVSIYTYGQRSTSTPAEAAIVLGASVWDEEPSPVFRERIRHAIDLYRSGQVRKLVFTGGIGSGKKIAESEAAKRYAIRAGVPESDILTEAESHTTSDNLRFAQQVAERHHLTNFLVVSDPLHMKRAMAMAADLKMNAHPSPTPTTRYRTARSQWDFLMRETYFYIDYRSQQLIPGNPSHDSTDSS